MISHHNFGQTPLFRSIPHDKGQVRMCPLQHPQVGSNRLELPSEYGLEEISEQLSGAAERERSASAVVSTQQWKREQSKECHHATVSLQCILNLV